MSSQLRTTQRIRFAPCRSLRASPHLPPLRSGKRRIRWKRCAQYGAAFLNL